MNREIKDFFLVKCHSFLICEPIKTSNQLKKDVYLSRLTKINRLMQYNWQQKDWPNFKYSLTGLETELQQYAEKNRTIKRGIKCFTTRYSITSNYQ